MFSHRQANLLKQHFSRSFCTFPRRKLPKILGKSEILSVSPVLFIRLYVQKTVTKVDMFLLQNDLERWNLGPLGELFHILTSSQTFMRGSLILFYRWLRIKIAWILTGILCSKVSTLSSASFFTFLLIFSDSQNKNGPPRRKTIRQNSWKKINAQF